MESKLLQLNGSEWSAFRLGEKAWLLTPRDSNVQLRLIHEATKIIEDSNINGIVDIIPAYDSITLIFDRADIDIKISMSQISVSPSPKKDSVLHKINVCYELGLDWEEVEGITGLKKEEIISIHLSPTYTVAMTGFLPGFIFLEGLDERIIAPRRSNPRTAIPSGAVGIGGSQTGIYSLESPGGWQIIGRSSELFFNKHKNPPMQVKAGDRIEFQRISETEYQKKEPIHE
ncbi:MAG: 5-oxoprolinase subunit PxpB [Balneola sp.]